MVDSATWVVAMRSIRGGDVVGHRRVYRHAFRLAGLLALLLAGCGGSKPEPVAPSDVDDFCKKTAAELQMAEAVELKGAAISEECLSLENKPLSACPAYQAVMKRWEERYQAWQAC